MRAHVSFSFFLQLIGYAHLCYASERSEVDPVNRQMVLRTHNVSIFLSFLCIRGKKSTQAEKPLHAFSRFRNEMYRIVNDEVSLHYGVAAIRHGSFSFDFESAIDTLWRLRDYARR